MFSAIQHRSLRCCVWRCGDSQSQPQAGQWLQGERYWADETFFSLLFLFLGGIMPFCAWCIICSNTHVYYASKHIYSTAVCAWHVHSKTRVPTTTSTRIHISCAPVHTICCLTHMCTCAHTHTHTHMHAHRYIYIWIILLKTGRKCDRG